MSSIKELSGLTFERIFDVKNIFENFWPSLLIGLIEDITIVFFFTFPPKMSFRKLLQSRDLWLCNDPSGGD